MILDIINIVEMIAMGMRLAMIIPVRKPKKRSITNNTTAIL